MFETANSQNNRMIKIAIVKLRVWCQVVPRKCTTKTRKSNCRV